MDFGKIVQTFDVKNQKKNKYNNKKHNLLNNKGKEI